MIGSFFTCRFLRSKDGMVGLRSYLEVVSVGGTEIHVGDGP